MNPHWENRVSFVLQNFRGFHAPRRVHLAIWHQHQENNTALIGGILQVAVDVDSVFNCILIK